MEDVGYVLLQYQAESVEVEESPLNGTRNSADS